MLGVVWHLIFVQIILVICCCFTRAVPTARDRIGFRTRVFNLTKKYE